MLPMIAVTIPMSEDHCRSCEPPPPSFDLLTANSVAYAAPLCRPDRRCILQSGRISAKRKRYPSCLLALGVQLCMGKHLHDLVHDEHDDSAEAPSQRKVSQAICSSIPVTRKSRLVGMMLRCIARVSAFLRIRLGKRHLHPPADLDQTTLFSNCQLVKDSLSITSHDTARTTTD
jgi:hypothetical protein